MIRVLEKIIMTGLFLLAIVIGAGMAMIVTKAVDYTWQTACFDYKTPEACEEIRNEEI